MKHAFYNTPLVWRAWGIVPKRKWRRHIMLPRARFLETDIWHYTFYQTELNYVQAFRPWQARMLLERMQA
mgnify:CR=1 FL=1